MLHLQDLGRVWKAATRKLRQVMPLLSHTFTPPKGKFLKLQPSECARI